MSAPSSPPTVLVTGAAKRLGREIALKLAASGWRVAVHYRDSLEDATKTVADCARLTKGSAAFRSNLANETAVRRLLPTVIEELGHVDAVVNSASTFEHDTAASFSFAAMDKHMRSNAGAAILLSQALHQHLAQRQQALGPKAAPLGGAVVNLLDQKLWNQNPDFMSYTLSKAALEAATTMLALALSPSVRVVGVAPGLTLTSHLLSEDKFAALHKLSPLGRSSTPQDVAATVLFALQNQSITGTTLLVDGGQHLMRFDRDFSLM
ncbi:SDR family oxidoreductase [Rhodoferax saidenbachensis]|uniref:Short chain dehydrogenase n=1 Tax=Rhodoferax saidenbachensis TaxID=1484693 RepID=A0A1P8K6V0_9BURK|nr:SDR family oxidoreductase [Rhodoferax saidenbachensis]APW41728.1 short chain dehydrogenase [Rhodoferax saidenbachensis]